MKHLHHEAVHNYDIGVYFEANGHGTVIFNPALLEYLTTVDHPAAKTILHQADLINQTVGDALSDLLLVLSILMTRPTGGTFEAWAKEYTDLPNKLSKVTVRDRSAFETEDVDRKLVKPVGLQPKIDALVSQYTRGRSFVRPSGTEDVVRVYAEAESAADVEALSLAVSRLVYDEAGGIGTRP